MLARFAEFCWLQARCTHAHRVCRDESIIRAIGPFAGIAYVVVIIAVALLPETRGKQLAVYD